MKHVSPLELRGINLVPLLPLFFSCISFHLCILSKKEKSLIRNVTMTVKKSKVLKRKENQKERRLHTAMCIQQKGPPEKHG